MTESEKMRPHWRARHWHFAPMRPIIAGAIINDYCDADSRGVAPCCNISPLQGFCNEGFCNAPLFAVMDSRSGAGMTENEKPPMIIAQVLSFWTADKKAAIEARSAAGGGGVL